MPVCPRISGRSISPSATTSCSRVCARTTRSTRQAIYLLGAKGGASTSLPEVQEAHQVDWHGLHDPVLRLADMDREGITAELIYHGDFRLGDMFHNVTDRVYSFDAWETAARLEPLGGRQLLVRHAPIPGDRRPSAPASTWTRRWPSSSGSPTTGSPARTVRATCAIATCPRSSTRTGSRSGRSARSAASRSSCTPGSARSSVPCSPRSSGSTTMSRPRPGAPTRASLFEHADAVSDDSLVFFNDFLNHNVDSRRPMWQMMLGGVFDRHPDLKLVLTEIRLDWIPATLRHLDAAYEQHRAALPAKRTPSEYWRDQLPGRRVVHPPRRGGDATRDRCRDHVVRRDFPHPEGTWPHAGVVA